MSKTKQQKASESMAQHQASVHGIGIGTKPGEEAVRDAIHIAVVPLIAGEKLERAEPVTIIGGKAMRPTDNAKMVGLVDPWLHIGVLPGERCWVFLEPGSITSLRHDWTHPALEEHDHAMAWMETYAADVKKSVQVIIDSATRYIESHGTEHNHGGSENEGLYVPEEFWHYWELITGKKYSQISEYGDHFFSCSC